MLCAIQSSLALRLVRIICKEFLRYSRYYSGVLIVRSCTCICFNCLVTYHSVCSLLDWYALFVGNLSSISCIFGVHKVRSCACIPIYFLPYVLMTSFRGHYRWNFSILDRIHRVELFGDPDICYKIEKQM